MSDTSAERYRDLLHALGLDPASDPELRDTPERASALLREWFVPVQALPELRPIPLENPAGAKDIVVLRDLPYHAMCAHHVVPFFGHVHIAFLPERSIAGFGAFAEILAAACRGPQLQERLAARLADHLQAQLEPVGLVLRMDARQLCMEMAGARSCGSASVIAGRGCWEGQQAHSVASELFGRAAP